MAPLRVLLRLCFALIVLKVTALFVGLQVLYANAPPAEVTLVASSVDDRRQLVSHRTNCAQIKIKKKKNSCVDLPPFQSFSELHSKNDRIQMSVYQGREPVMQTAKWFYNPSQIKTTQETSLIVVRETSYSRVASEELCCSCIGMGVLTSSDPFATSEKLQVSDRTIFGVLDHSTCTVDLLEQGIDFDINDQQSYRQSTESQQMGVYSSISRYRLSKDTASPMMVGWYDTKIMRLGAHSAHQSFIITSQTTEQLFNFKLGANLAAVDKVQRLQSQWLFIGIGNVASFSTERQGFVRGSAGKAMNENIKLLRAVYWDPGPVDWIRELTDMEVNGVRMQSFNIMRSLCSERPSEFAQLPLPEPTVNHGRRKVLATIGWAELKEKNWSPFLFNGTTLWSYMLHPGHVVCAPDIDLEEVASSSLSASIDCLICKRQHTSSSKLALAGLVASVCDGCFTEIHLNGVPSYHIPGEAETDFYLGIAHLIIHPNPNYKEYVHFFYKFEAVPPFRVTAVSRTIDLKSARSNAGWFTIDVHAEVAFVSGLELLDNNSLGENKLENFDLRISYGVADSLPYVKTMSVSEALAMFTPPKQFNLGVQAIVAKHEMHQIDRILELVAVSNQHALTISGASKLMIGQTKTFNAVQKEANQQLGLDGVSSLFSSSRAPNSDIKAGNENAAKYFSYEIAVSKSHMAIWREMLDLKTPASLIVEADVEFCRDFGVKAGAILDSTPPGFDVLYLGHCFEDTDTDAQVSRNLVKSQHPFCMHGYIMSLSGAAKALALESLNPIITVADEALAAACSAGTLDCYSAKRNIMFQLPLEGHGLEVMGCLGEEPKSIDL